MRPWLWIVAAGAAGGLALAWFAAMRPNDSEPAQPVLVAKGLIPRGTPGTVVSSSTGSVASIVDGDTLRLADGTRVRLVQIDAPERGECYSRRATGALVRLAPRGVTPLLFSDPGLDVEDNYGRLLAYVEIDDRVINIELVRAGAAVPYFFHGDRGVYAGELLAAARDARRERRGLWAACPGAKLDPNRGALTGPA